MFLLGNNINLAACEISVWKWLSQNSEGILPLSSTCWGCCQEVRCLCLSCYKSFWDIWSFIVYSHLKVRPPKSWFGSLVCMGRDVLTFWLPCRVIMCEVPCRKPPKAICCISLSWGSLVFLQSPDCSHSEHKMGRKVGSGEAPPSTWTFLTPPCSVAPGVSTFRGESVLPVFCLDRGGQLLALQRNTEDPEGQLLLLVTCNKFSYLGVYLRTLFSGEPGTSNLCLLWGGSMNWFAASWLLCPPPPSTLVVLGSALTSKSSASCLWAFWFPKWHPYYSAADISFPLWGFALLVLPAGPFSRV